MRSIIAGRRAFALVALSTTGLIPERALPAQDSLRLRSGWEYAVKVVCGPTQANSPVAPGRYFTAINVHNPSDSVTPLQYKVAFTLSAPSKDPTPGLVSRWSDSKLRDDQSLEIDCNHIVPRAQEAARAAAPGTPQVVQFVKGFVVIQSPRQLDVVAVYTSAGPTPRIQTFALERVPTRRLPIQQ